jgi:hypothetical protein
VQDQQRYEDAVEAWFSQNPYYPQFIDTGNPARDYNDWMKAKTEWCNRYPAECHEVESHQSNTNR